MTRAGGPSAAMDNGRSWPGVRREVPAGDEPSGDVRDGSFVLI